MKLITRRSTYNFYESFSDLIFCALVLFLFMVLSLVLNVNRKLTENEQTVAAALASAKQKLDAAQLVMHDAEEAAKTFDEEHGRKANELLAREAQLKSEIAELQHEKRRVAVDVERERMRLQVDVGRNRFLGLDHDVKMAIAIDIRKNNEKMWFIPFRLLDELQTLRSGETSEQQGARHKRAYREIDDILRSTRSYSLNEAATILTAVSDYWVPAKESAELFGVVYDTTSIGDVGTLVDAVVPFSAAHIAGLKPGDEITAIDGVNVMNATVDEVRALFKAALSTSRMSVTYVRGDEKRTALLQMTPTTFSAGKVGVVSTIAVLLLASGGMNENYDVDADRRLSDIVASPDFAPFGIIAEKVSAARKVLKRTRRPASGTLPEIVISTSEDGRFSIGDIVLTISDIEGIMSSFTTAGVAIRFDGTIVPDNVLPLLKRIGYVQRCTSIIGPQLTIE